MKTKTWLKFVWELGKIPEPPAEGLGPLHMRAAAPDEQTQVIDVLAKATALDSSLGEAGRVLQHYFTALAPRLWRSKEPTSLAVFHGERIIAASVYLASPDEEFQLASGPCVLSEYRNRGIGSWLLQTTLFNLQAAGLQEARGACKQHSVLAKYLYPKFGGRPTPYEFAAEKT